MKISEILNNDESNEIDNPFPNVISQSEYRDYLDAADEVEHELFSTMFGDDPAFNRLSYGGKRHKLFDKLPVKEIPHKDMVSIEFKLNPKHLAALKNNTASSSSEVPVVTKVNNKYYIDDGNHRVVADYLAGKKSSKVMVMEI